MLDKIPISACRYSYKSSFIKNNNILFPEGKFFEDNIFVICALLQSNRFGFVNKIYYNRTMHKNQTTANWKKHFNDFVSIVDIMPNYINKIDTSVTNKFISKYCDICLSIYNNLENKYQYTKNVYNLLKKHSNIYTLSQYATDFIINCESLSNYKYSLVQWYKQVTKEILDLDDPKTFNEKIQWMKLYDSTPIKTRLADKYLVREWVAEKIGEKYLIPLLGVYDRFDEIDFDSLPERFVIKCNHGCAYNIIVKDKSTFDKEDARKKVNVWMQENYAFKAGYELHYRNIPPKIIIESFIENKSAADLYDYKFWCFNGEVKYVQFLSERNTAGLKMAFYDRAWNKQSFVYSYPLDQKEIPRPDNLDEMIHLAEELSKGFNHVRVDFYRLDDGPIYFGEMTFTSASGSGKWNDNAIHRQLGDWIQLPDKAYNIDTQQYYTLEKSKKRFLRKFKFNDEKLVLLGNFPLYRRTKRAGKTKVYLCGIQFFKKEERCIRKKVYILGIPVYSGRIKKR